VRSRDALRLATRPRRRHIAGMMLAHSPLPLRLLLLALLLAAVILSVAGCGRKGQPEPPPGSDFPRTYPSQ